MPACAAPFYTRLAYKNFSADSETINKVNLFMNTDTQFPAPLKAIPGYKELVLRVVPMPADCNSNGDIFGGWLMAQMDLAGAALACRAANDRKMVTVAVNSLVFKHPVGVGDLLSFYAEIIKIGNTSITIEVTAYAWNDENFMDTPVKVTEATITYVAMDKNGQPRPVLQHRA